MEKLTAFYEGYVLMSTERQLRRETLLSGYQKQYTSQLLDKFVLDQVFLRFGTLALASFALCATNTGGGVVFLEF